jgi:F-type H+-transporting ATPase subunit c
MEGLMYVGVGLLAFGMFGAALGVGNVFSALITGIARNPSAEKQLFKNAIIGAALAEAMGIFSLGIALLILFK